jgi:SAM-dependent methyltransferase
VDQFKIRDSSSYDSVAESFARFTDIVTKPLAETMVRLAGPAASGRLLDVGTGSGIVALRAAEQPGVASVAGVDLSGGLLDLARRKARDAGVSGEIQFVRSDAEALPFADRSFDAVLSLFALLHFPHPEVALCEMIRVLKPGGRLVIGIGSAPPWLSWRGWRHRFGRLSDLLDLKTGKLLLAPSHLNELVERLLPSAVEPEETELARDPGARAPKAATLIRNLGLTDLKTHWEGHHLRLPHAAEFWELQSTFSSIARKRLESCPEGQIQKVRQAFDESCRRVLRRDGRLEYHYAALYFHGTRPGPS